MKLSMLPKDNSHQANNQRKIASPTPSYEFKIILIIFITDYYNIIIISVAQRSDTKRKDIFVCLSLRVCFLLSLILAY